METVAVQYAVKTRRQAQDELAQAVAHAVETGHPCDRSYAVKAAAAELVASIERELSQP